MKEQILRTAAISALMIGSARAGLDDYHDAAYYDAFNPPPSTFNTESWQVGFDSDGSANPNALQWNETIMVQATNLYDNHGNKLVENGADIVTEAGPVGYYNGVHYGKVHAGAWAQIKINGITRECVYLAAAEVQNGGTYSGWVRVDRMAPQGNLSAYSQTIHGRRESPSVRYTANPGGSPRYIMHTVLDVPVPTALEESYIIPNRTSSAGKAKYYYIREGVLNGFINLPETGNKRHGVQCSRVAIGGCFWRDMDVNDYVQNLYGYDSSTVIATFRWCFGYYETNTGQKIYCWTNRDCLDDPTPVVTFVKRSALGYGIDGGSGGANGQNVCLWSHNAADVNQQWEEIDRGGGFFSYQKAGTSFSLDGGNGGANGQNVYLWTTGATNHNQHWQKIDKGGGYYQLRKRNSTGYAINGGSGGANGQNVNLYNSGSSSNNLQWRIGYN